MRVSLTILSALSCAVMAQDFAVPSTWRKSNATQSRDERIAIARRAIDYVNGFYDSGAGLYSFSDQASSDDTFIDHNNTIESARHGASMLRYSAMHDLMAGTVVYQSFVTSALKRAVTITPFPQNLGGTIPPPTGTIFGIRFVRSFLPLGDTVHTNADAGKLDDRDIQIGLAAVYAYRAYNDSSMLEVARDMQQVIQNTTLFGPTPSTYPGAQLAILKCATTGIGSAILPYLLGNAPSTSHLIQDGWVQSSDWAGFLALSAYVALGTTSAVFEDGATIYGYLTSSGLNLVDAKTSFAHSILVYNATTGNRQDIDSPIYTDAAHNFTNCAPVDAGSPTAGVYVEALSVYANLTETPTIQAQHLQALASATTYGLSSDGIISDDRPPYLIGRGGHLAGLMDTLLRSTNESVKAYIQAYANVQFNALQDFAINPDNQTYSSTWTAHDGDTGGTFNIYYQVEAIPALNLAIGLPPSSATATPPVSATAAPTQSRNSQVHGEIPIGAVAGGITGGVVVAIIAIVWTLLCFRRRRRLSRAEEVATPESPARFVPEPYNVLLADTSGAGLLLDSGGAPRFKGSGLNGASSGADSNSQVPHVPHLGSEAAPSAEMNRPTANSNGEEEDATEPDALFERIPTRHLARILHERVTGVAPGDADEYEWRLGGTDRVTSPPSYRSRSLHQG